MSDNNSIDNEKTIFNGLSNAYGQASGTDMFFVVREDPAGRYPVKESRPLTVGRNRDQDVVLRDSMVSREHLLIKRRGPCAIIEIKGRNGLEMDEKIYRNQIIECGSNRFLIGKTLCGIESETTILAGGNDSPVRPRETISLAPGKFAEVKRPEKRKDYEDYDNFDFHGNDFGPEIIEQSSTKGPSSFFSLFSKTAWFIIGCVVALIAAAVVIRFFPGGSNISFLHHTERETDDAIFERDRPVPGKDPYVEYVLARAEEHMLAGEWDRAGDVLKAVPSDHPDALLLLEKIDGKSGRDR